MQNRDIVSMKIESILPAELLAKFSRLSDAENCKKIASQLVSVGKYDKKKADLAYSVGEDGKRMYELKTFKDVSESATLATIKKYRGEYVIVWLYAWITELARFFSVNNGIKEETTEMIVDLILSEYYFLTVDDFKFFSKKAVLGDFGTAYNRFDITTLLEWIDKYVQERSDYFEMQKTIDNKKVHLSEKTIPMPDKIRQLIERLDKKTKKPSFDELYSEFKVQWELEYKNIEGDKPLFLDYCKYQYNLRFR